MYNPELTTTYWNVDQKWNMLQNLSITEVYDDGHYDSVGGSCLAYLTYKDPRFIEGIKSCWIKTPNKFGKGYYYKGQRYPEKMWSDIGIGISRDHTIYSFIAWKKAGWTNEQIWEYASHMPFSLGNEMGMKMNLSLWLWLRLISGKSIGKLWYISLLLESLLYVGWNKLMDIITGGYPDEKPQDEYVFKQNKTKWDKLKNNLFFPTFALNLLSFQMMVVPKNNLIKLTNKLLLKITPKENFLLKVMFGEEVTEEQVSGYKPMYGSRWSDELVPERTRSSVLEIITNPKHIEANTLDKDLLMEMYRIFKK